MAMRHAIYFCPLPGDPLCQLAASWLGRDPHSGAAIERDRPDGFGFDEFEALVAAPARYAFHATLKAPFHLADGRSPDELDAALATFCARQPSVNLGQVEIGRIGGFFAIVVNIPPPELGELEAAIVREFEPFRAPPDTDEIAKRQPQLLSPRQRDYLDEFGYPYVLDEFRFHMTLTGRVAEIDCARVERALADWFAPVLPGRLTIGHLARFVEEQPGGDFSAASMFALGG